MKKTRLSEEEIKTIVTEAVRKIVSETMGISDTMEMDADRITNEISERLKAAPICADGQSYKYRYKSISYYSDFSNPPILWNIRGIVHPFHAKDESYDFWTAKGGGATDGKKLFLVTITLNLDCDGWFDKPNLCDCIYHEMLHIFKSMNAGKNIGHEMFNAKVATEMQRARGIEKSIATILYLSVPDEQDAFVTGFYGQAKRDFVEGRTFNIQESYYKSELYAQTIELKKSINDILQYEDVSKINEILKTYQTKDEHDKVIPLNLGKLIRLGNHALDRLVKKTAQIINRLNMFKIKNGFRPNVSKKIKYPGMPENDFSI